MAARWALVALDRVPPGRRRASRGARARRLRPRCAYAGRCAPDGPAPCAPRPPWHGQHHGARSVAWSAARRMGLHVSYTQHGLDGAADRRASPAGCATHGAGAQGGACPRGCRTCGARGTGSARAVDQLASRALYGIPVGHCCPSAMRRAAIGHTPAGGAARHARAARALAHPLRGTVRGEPHAGGRMDGARARQLPGPRRAGCLGATRICIASLCARAASLGDSRRWPDRRAQLAHEPVPVPWPRPADAADPCVVRGLGREPSACGATACGAVRRCGHVTSPDCPRV